MIWPNQHLKVLSYLAWSSNQKEERKDDSISFPFIAKCGAVPFYLLTAYFTFVKYSWRASHHCSCKFFPSLTVIHRKPGEELCWMKTTWPTKSGIFLSQHFNWKWIWVTSSQVSFNVERAQWSSTASKFALSNRHHKSNICKQKAWMNV